MAQVAIRNEHNYPIQEDRVNAVVERVLKDQGEAQEYQVSIAFVDDTTMRRLNLEYHDVDDTTDVLSFPYLDPQSRKEDDFVVPLNSTPVLGDLVISFPTAKKEADRKNISLQEELDFLVDHGMHHLLGIHHD